MCDLDSSGVPGSTRQSATAVSPPKSPLRLVLARRGGCAAMRRGTTVELSGAVTRSTPHNAGSAVANANARHERAGDTHDLLQPHPHDRSRRIRTGPDRIRN